jgi:hypothetical protein
LLGFVRARAFPWVAATTFGNGSN